MKCPHCQTENKDTAKFCGKCGQSLAISAHQSETTTPCPDCGNACKAEAKFCPKCGHNFSAASAPEPAVMASADPSPANVEAPETMPCPHCGAALKPSAKFCGKCGNSVVAAKQEEAPSIPEVAEATLGLALEATQELSQTSLAGESSAIQASFDATIIAPAEPAIAVEAPTGSATCPHCGVALKPGTKFCGKCGNSVAAATQPEPEIAEAIPVPAMEATQELPPSHPVGEKTLNQPLHELLGKREQGADRAVQTPEPVPSPEVAKPAAKAPTSEPLQKPRKIPMAPIAAGVAALAIMAGAGGYFVVKGKAPTETKEAVSDKPVMQASAAPAVPAKPEELSPPNLNQGAPRAAPAPVASAPAQPATPAPVAAPSESKPKPAPTAVAPAQAHSLQVAIDASMEEGEKCMGRKKYDCAISSANTALRLDPNNTRAQDMKRKAKEAQDRALSQIDIQ